MNLSLLQNEARKELENAKAKAAKDEKAAQVEKRASREAKLQLQEARKHAKSTKKSAKKARAQTERSLEALERARTKWEKLQKRARKQKHEMPVAAESQPPRLSKRSKSKTEPPLIQRRSARSTTRAARPRTKPQARRVTPGHPSAAKLKHVTSIAATPSAPANPSEFVNGQPDAPMSETMSNSKKGRTSTSS